MKSTRSDWACTLEREETGPLSLRLGLRYVRGLRESSAAEIVSTRELMPFGSVDEVARRVPSLTRAELGTLVEVGALNPIAAGIHRRDALWQIERAARATGPLLAALDREEEYASSPLRSMDTQERMIADYRTTGLTVAVIRWLTIGRGFGK